ncbi:MAG: DUF4347 domain-containing protein [Leptolyngbyaceae cyanobacterium bins.59]|nr:DUF4347 domain-containing protein [Leptolyngbyaceae cyanobacterium bins.59]
MATIHRQQRTFMKPPTIFSADFSLLPVAPATIAPTLVVVDGGVENLSHLLNGLIEDIEVLILDQKRDGIEQITEAMHQYWDIAHLHIIAHGTPGCLYLGNTQLSLSTIDAYDLQLMSWFFATSHHAVPCSISLYSCNVATGKVGAALLHRLHALTGVTIAASSQPIGAGFFGNNWELDIRVGDVPNSAIPPCPFHPETLASYPGNLQQSRIG